MKKRRLFILICAMLISLALVGCASNLNNSEIEVAIETEMDAGTDIEVSSETQDMEKTPIKASIAVQYSDREISVYSDTSCFFTIDVDIRDIDCVSTNNYGPFEISAGEKLNFTIDELSPDFFSDKARIENVSSYTFIYGYSSLNEWNFKMTDKNIEFKCYPDKIVLRANEDCLVSFFFQTMDENFESGYANIELLKINANEITTFTLDDLAPGFYSDNAEIVSYSPLSIHTYVEK